MQVKKLARGRLLKTKVKEAKKIAEATEIGKESGKQKAHKKKNLEYSLREHIGKFIDRIEPIEFIGLLSTTWVIHGIILTTAELYERATNISKGLRVISGTPDIVKYLPFGDTPLAWASNLPFLISKIWDIYTQKGATDEQKQQIVEGTKKLLEAPDPESIDLWIVSLAIAYYIQKHGILNILNGVKGFLGLATSA